MSNIGGVNGIGINGASAFDPVAEARGLGEINSFAINGNEAINGSAYISSVLNPTAAEIEQSVCVLFSGVVATIEQEVLLRSTNTGLSSPITFAQQVIQIFSGDAIDLQQMVVDDG